MKIFDSIKTGLHEAIEYEKGNIKAKSVSISVEPLQNFSASEIREIRNNLGLTQALFGAVIGVSTKTVEAWETGTNQPNGAAKRIISLIKFDPQFLEKYHIVSKN
ncbi:MAG: helix-turn-helix domain-containing protein [Oscillospiraceae bacterium]|nr:helix-turn-helix domain-containing protein [Oscillospiraceae bacterium]